jgi:hypothetical protein
MSVQFSAAVPEPDEHCFCYDPLTSDVVTHGGQHPVHLKCLQTWAKVSPTCPTCRQEIDTSSILPYRERTILWIKREFLGIGTSHLNDVLVFPGALWGGMASLAVTATPKTKGVVALSLLAGTVAVAAVMSTRINSLPPSMRIPATMTMAFLGSYMTATIISGSF